MKSPSKGVALESIMEALDDKIVSAVNTAAIQAARAGFDKKKANRAIAKALRDSAYYALKEERR